MRVIAGKHRGRKIESPEGNRVRPTSDMVRGAIFNILHNSTDWENTAVLDVCCGTGAFGIEALSRGAKFAGFIDSHRESIKYAEKNIAAIKEQTNAAIFCAAVEKLPRADREYNLVFIDPPYKTGLCDVALTALIKHGWIAHDATIVLELSEKEELKSLELLDISRERFYGITKVVFANLAGSRKP